MKTRPSNILKCQLTVWTWILALSIVHPGSSLAQSKINWLFKNHRDGYPMFRIPTMLSLPNGIILAFCEGRQSLMDHGNIDLVMKSSSDSGKTWSKLHVVWDQQNHTCGNPVPVFEAQTQTLFLIATLDNDSVFVLSSTDFGNSWNQPRNITAMVKPSNWEWYATGPVHGIQLQRSVWAGRLVVPCNHTVRGSSIHQSHAIFSDDQGKTWSRSENVPDQKTDECTLAECSNGELYLNMRNSDRRLPNRKVCYSKDGGSHWTNGAFDSVLVEPICQGSVLSLTDHQMVFSNPYHRSKRKNLTLSFSRDNGQTWYKRIPVFHGKAAYSDLIQLNHSQLLICFETGKFLPYGGIVFTTISY
ncbi:MAG: glycoside hydrolase [Bacteroidia bacterium]|nr:glycoside hydrolase [Bacteroidia bacterium]